MGAAGAQQLGAAAQQSALWPQRRCFLNQPRRLCFLPQQPWLTGAQQSTGAGAQQAGAAGAAQAGAQAGAAQVGSQGAAQVGSQGAAQLGPQSLQPWPPWRWNRPAEAVFTPAHRTRARVVHFIILNSPRLSRGWNVGDFVGRGPSITAASTEVRHSLQCGSTPKVFGFRPRQSSVVLRSFFAAPPSLAQQTGCDGYGERF